ncbi:hypothetical protein RND81_08G228200 [Saponaria officinalis]|uniref:GDSL esterase/lipase n=1 Tax=Saponaria officinalis TaxID=3572 RepID=A0AAW1JBI4_SAPOF
MKALIASVVVTLAVWSTSLGKCRSQTQGVPAVYAFGDSLVDTGNNNWLPVSAFARANYTPYGTDFPEGIATGRVTNGINVPDLIAEFLGLPFTTPDKNPNLPISLTGYNYGSAGGGILRATGPIYALDLTEQVKLFGVTKETKLRPAFKDEAELEYHLANSIYFIWVGNNDYLLNYFDKLKNTSKEYTPEEFANLLTSTLSEKLQLLYETGARKMVVFELPPLGCIPVSVDANGTCNELRNSNATLFNTKLAEMLQSLSTKLPDSYLSLGKTYDLTSLAINDPAHYGLTNVTHPCCQLATLIGLPLLQCKKAGNICGNRNEYLFWDAAHPSEAGYRVLGGQCITNSTVCTPYSVQDLAQLTVHPSSLLSAA